MAPSTSPICRALLVPTAWAAVPMPMPRAMGWVMWQTLQTVSAISAPRMPVKITIAPVRAAMPPSSWLTSMLMAVVTLLGSSVMYWLWSSFSSRASTRTLPRLASVPARIPMTMASTFLRSRSHFSYSGTARLTVAGSSR